MIKILNNYSSIVPYVDVTILLVSALFVYRQIKIAIRSQWFSTMIEIDHIFEEVNDLYKDICASFPKAIVMKKSQFPKKPPHRHRSVKYNEGQQRRMALVETQKKAIESLADEQIMKARRIIDLLNTIGQYIEDGFINYNLVLGKYHTMIIRICFLVEPIRRMIETGYMNSIGGNYGHRILRMYNKAILYQNIHSKHRGVDIKLKTKDGVVDIIQGEESSFLYVIPLLFNIYQYRKK